MIVIFIINNIKKCMWNSTQFCLRPSLLWPRTAGQGESLAMPEKLNFHTCLEWKIAFFRACFVFIRLPKGSWEAWKKHDLKLPLVFFFFKSLYHLFWNFKKHQEGAQDCFNVHQEGVQVWKTETSHKCVCFCWGHAPHSLVSPKRMQKGWAGVSFPRRSPCKGNK